MLYIIRECNWRIFIIIQACYWKDLFSYKSFKIAGDYDSRQTGYFREDIIIDEMEYEHIGRYECFAMNYNQKLRSTIVHLKMDGIVRKLYIILLPTSSLLISEFTTKFFKSCV